jgi:site-specific DNA recombinase
MVIDALRLQLSDPALIREYVKTYRDERNRAESEARRKRSTLDRDYAKAKSEIQRVVGSIAKGLITEEEAASLLGAARCEIARLESELATGDNHTNVIELHPQAVQRFKENLDALADILIIKDALPDLELMGTFRSLVESVIVSPRKAGEEYEVSIRGYLASLMGAEVSALLMVAGGGLEPPTPGL